MNWYIAQPCECNKRRRKKKKNIKKSIQRTMTLWIRGNRVLCNTSMCVDSSDTVKFHFLFLFLYFRSSHFVFFAFIQYFPLSDSFLKIYQFLLFSPIVWFFWINWWYLILKILNWFNYLLNWRWWKLSIEKFHWKSKAKIVQLDKKMTKKNLSDRQTIHLLMCVVCVTILLLLIFARCFSN